MATENLTERLYQAMVNLDDEEVCRLPQEGIDAGLAPMDMVIDGLSPALNAIGVLSKSTSGL